MPPPRPAFRRVALPFGRSIAGFGAAAALSASGIAAAQAGGSDRGALQIVADVILIESECRDLNVDYGKLYGFAQRNGITPTDIMPTGDRRAAFDVDYKRRAREIPDELLCTDFASERAVIIPGVFKPR